MQRATNHNFKSLIISSLDFQNDKSNMMSFYAVAANNAEGMYLHVHELIWLMSNSRCMHIAHLINAAYRMQVITN